MIALGDMDQTESHRPDLIRIERHDGVHAEQLELDRMEAQGRLLAAS